MENMELEKKNGKLRWLKTSMEVEEWRISHDLEEDSKISDEESPHLKHLAKIRFKENYRHSKIHSSRVS